jgi:hypothetical protein
MGCGCKQKTVNPFQVRKRWSQKLINEVSLLYSDILPIHKKTDADWDIIFTLFATVFPNSSITEKTLSTQKIVTNQWFEFYKDFLVIKENYGTRKSTK